MNRPDPETLRRAISIMELRTSIDELAKSTDSQDRSLVVVNMYNLRDAVRSFMNRATLPDFLLLIPNSEHHLKSLQDMLEPPAPTGGPE